MYKNGKTFLIIVFICSIILSACSSNKIVNQDIEEYMIQNKNLQLKMKGLEETVQRYKDAEDSAMQTEADTKPNFRITDILHVKELNGTYYIVLSIYGDDETGGVQLWKYSGKTPASMLAEGIDINIETRDPNLYCTVSKSIGKDEYKEEVVKFDRDDNKSIIYAGKNVEISASPDGEYFIIIENPYFLDRNLKSVRNLKILDRNDKVIFDEIIESNMDTDLEPYGWNGKEFWGIFRFMAGRPEILILNAETFKFDVIENKADHCEFDLNMKNGWICYSDFPLFFEIDSYNEFKKSKEDVNLYLYNIFTEEKIHIVTLIAKEFSPKWINEFTFEYNDSNSDQRLRYTLKTER